MTYAWKLLYNQFLFIYNYIYIYTILTLHIHKYTIVMYHIIIVTLIKHEVVNTWSIYVYIYTALIYMDPWIYDQLPLHIRQVVCAFVLASFYLPSAPVF